jgi:hypothetical protein
VSPLAIRIALHRDAQILNLRRCWFDKCRLLIVDFSESIEFAIKRVLVSSSTSTSSFRVSA